jgi:hypothetical protein
MALSHREEIHYSTCKRTVGPRGGETVKVETWRVNGACKIWKTRPLEFSVPIKFGLYASSYLTDRNGEDFHLASECNLSAAQKVN